MIVLASGSPRRRELLAQVGVDFTVQVFEIDESVQPNESPAHYVERLALEKAASARPHVSAEAIVIAADTTVTVDGEILAKPIDYPDAVRMWRLLSGRQHQVMTGVAVSTAMKSLSTVVHTTVAMRTLSESEMWAYWQTGEPLGKAGGYAIQGRAAAFIPRIEGSYSNVVGLPLVETLQLLQRASAMMDTTQH
ncbi:MAG: Maf family protein [Pseudomonadota bacterium]|nr:Maf family protein [Pseudomonadota bacterium]